MLDLLVGEWVDHDGVTVHVSPPSNNVLQQFGAFGSVVPLWGGQRTVWRCDELVFKQADTDAAAVDWIARVLPAVESQYFRLASPKRSSLTGELIVDGWTAWDYLPGRADRSRWREISTVGVIFADAFASVAFPDFLAERTDPWAMADRIAFDEMRADEVDEIPAVVHARRLLRHRDEAKSQIVHGDLAGNVLFDSDEPPAVLDLSLYRRPREYGSAVVVADTILAAGMSDDVRAGVGDAGFPTDLVLRALIFRLATDVLRRQSMFPEPTFAAAIGAVESAARVRRH